MIGVEVVVLLVLLRMRSHKRSQNFRGWTWAIVVSSPRMTTPLPSPVPPPTLSSSSSASTTAGVTHSTSVNFFDGGFCGSRCGLGEVGVPLMVSSTAILTHVKRR